MLRSVPIVYWPNLVTQNNNLLLSLSILRLKGSSGRFWLGSPRRCHLSLDWLDHQIRNLCLYVALLRGSGDSRLVSSQGISDIALGFFRFRRGGSASLLGLGLSIVECPILLIMDQPHTISKC